MAFHLLFPSFRVLSRVPMDTLLARAPWENVMGILMICDSKWGVPAIRSGVSASTPSQRVSMNWTRTARGSSKSEPDLVMRNCALAPSVTQALAGAMDTMGYSRSLSNRLVAAPEGEPTL